MKSKNILKIIGIQCSLIAFLNIMAFGQTQNFNNGNLENVNAVWINDPGPEEGIKWLGTAANWSIDVSPINRTNADGNLNFHGISGEIVLWRPLLLKSELRVSGSGNHYISSGNLGLGTTNPSSKLSIRNVGATNGVKLLDFSEGDSESFLFKGDFLGTGASGNSLIIGSNVSGYQSNIMSWRGDGMVGIGSTSPVEKLHIESGALQFYKVGPDQDNVDIIKIGENTTPNEFSLQGMFYGIGEGGNAIKFRSMWNDNLLTIKGNGQIGMGTYNTGTHKLAVEGSIGAREVKVEASGWSDFVFENDYKLPTLEEVENYVIENKHLPEIPSKTDVYEEGINLGEMDAKLLQKIEELTLYLIEQNKEIEKLKIRIADLEI